MARKTAAHLFYALNGVVEAPDQWQLDAFGPEEGELMGRTLAPVTDVVIGRGLWEEWREYWPGKDEFGDFINPVRKHVITTTLHGELGWNSAAVDGDPVAYVRALQGDGDGDIAVAGGIDTIRSLFLAGVIDTLLLTVHPVAAPAGRRLFDESVALTRLTLQDSVTTSAGNVVLSYGLRR